MIFQKPQLTIKHIEEPEIEVGDNIAFPEPKMGWTLAGPLGVDDDAITARTRRLRRCSIQPDWIVSHKAGYCRSASVATLESVAPVDSSAGPCSCQFSRDRQCP